MNPLWVSPTKDESPISRLPFVASLAATYWLPNASQGLECNRPADGPGTAPLTSEHRRFSPADETAVQAYLHLIGLLPATRACLHPSVSRSLLQRNHRCGCDGQNLFCSALPNRAESLARGLCARPGKTANKFRPEKKT